MWPFLFVSLSHDFEATHSECTPICIQIAFSCGSVLGARRYGEFESWMAYIKMFTIFFLGQFVILKAFRGRKQSH